MRKVDITRVIVYSCAALLLAAMLSLYAAGWRSTAELSMSPTLAARSLVRVDFHRMPREGEMAIFWRPGNEHERSVKRVTKIGPKGFWMRADNFGWTGEDSDNYGWVSGSSVVGVVTDVFHPKRLANLRNPSGAIWNRLILTHAPGNLRFSENFPAIIVIQNDCFKLELPDQSIVLTRTPRATCCKWQGDLVVFQDNAGEAWYSPQQGKILKRISYADLADLGRKQAIARTQDGAAELAASLKMRGGFIPTVQKQLCDGNLNSAVLVYPNQRIRFPKPKSGCLVIAVCDPNRLGQLSSSRGGVSLHDGWNEIKTDSEMEFVFGLATSEEATASAPIAVLEVRQ